MANVLTTDKQLQILNLLVESNSIRAVNRLTGAHLQTILNLLVKFGGKCREFLDAEMTGLTLDSIQCDEIWTFCGKKQGRLTIEEKAMRHDIGDVYLWTCLDRETKLIPTFAIGKRSADMARRIMLDLRSRLVIPKPHASDAHAFRKSGQLYITSISTDGFAAYPEAVDLAFGGYARYGQLIKNYRNADQPGRYAPPEMIDAERKSIFGDIDESEICTSHVERNNLTIRTFMRRFTRLSLGFSKKLENLAAAVAMHMAYYNFCWRPATLGGYKTPAQAAGLTNRIWTFADLYQRVNA